MDKDYTPLDIDLFKKNFINQTKGKILFIFIAVITIIILGLLIVILMQRSGV